MDHLTAERIPTFQEKFLSYMADVEKATLKEIKEKKDLTPEIEEKLKAAIVKFKKEFGFEQ
jgi:F-type H+-transporting ATPase subunit alpha